ncbi:MAG: hypothetical protein AAGG48_05245 [Planctomycetota bacterium]
MKKFISSLVAIVMVAGATVIASEIELDGVKCIVASKRPASESKAADYKDATVYFCCGNCLSKFKKDSKPFAAKANKQLVSTKQYEQKGCPFSGGDINEETVIDVSGTKVAFCCNGCKGKAEKAEGEKQIELVFNDKSFKKAFAKKEKKSEGS